MSTEEITVSDKSLPKFSYHQALQLWFKLPDNSTHQVGTADILDLILFLASSSKAMKQKITRRDLLAMLEDDDSSEARFYVLNEFKHYRCNLRLFSTEQEAREAHKASQIVYTTT